MTLGGRRSSLYTFLEQGRAGAGQAAVSTYKAGQVAVSTC